ncbi:MAG: carboxypeptidase-like regulatory domain-containing protein, partial [Gemmatimonadales bacterium]
MKSCYRRLIGAGIGLVSLVFVASPLLAQGVTTAAVQGTVMSQDRAPLANAIVTVLNTSTGQRLQAVTRSNGRYVLENVPAGGPYVIEVRAIGFEAGRKTDITLALGQRFTADFSLTPSVVQLEELTITATVDPLINTGRTGPAQT